MVAKEDPEETWEAARLIPTSGISGAEEQERRAVSALLAVIGSVREFGRTLTKMAGAPAGKIECFTEVIFKIPGTKTTLRPDGLIRVTRGSRTWVALVEVKTGRNHLAADQLNGYADLARTQGYDALITISNEIGPSSEKHPTTGLDGRKFRKLSLLHLSWSQILTSAVMQKEYHGVEDVDQGWILSELIRYLEHPKSGALAFEDMGGNWVTVRDAVAAGTLRASDKEAISEVCANFDALMRFTSLHLGRRLGADVRHQLPRKEQTDPAVRQASLAASLVENGILSGDIRIPDTVGDITVTADLRAKRVVCHVDVDAPKTGRNKTRVNWIVRQLKTAPGGLRLEAYTPHQRGHGSAELLERVREEPDVLVTNGEKEINRFRIAQLSKMGTKRGTGTGAFIDTILEAIDAFYADVVQNLKEWQAPPPRAPRSTDAAKESEAEPVPVSLESASASDLAAISE